MIWFDLIWFDFFFLVIIIIERYIPFFFFTSEVLLFFSYLWINSSFWLFFFRSSFVLSFFRSSFFYSFFFGSSLYHGWTTSIDSRLIDFTDLEPFVHLLLCAFVVVVLFSRPSLITLINHTITLFLFFSSLVTSQFPSDSALSLSHSTPRVSLRAEVLSNSISI